MAIVPIYGEQTTTAKQQDAPVDVTDKHKLRVVLDAFPLGEEFNRDKGWLPATASAIARFFSRIYRRKRAVEKNMDPRTADELLGDWEDMYGLTPTSGQSLEDRRDAVLTKVRSLGGDTAAYYQALAVDFGYADAVVTDAADPCTAISPCTGSIQDAEWKVTFLVTAASQGATRDQLLQELINSQLLAGWHALYDFT